MQRYRFQQEIQAMETAKVLMKNAIRNVLANSKATNKLNYLSLSTGKIRKCLTGKIQKEDISLFTGKTSLL